MNTKESRTITGRLSGRTVSGEPLEGGILYADREFYLVPVLRSARKNKVPFYALYH